MRDDRFVGNGIVRAEMKLNDLVTAGGELIGPGNRRPKSAGDACAVVVLPVLREAFECGQEFAAGGAVRIVGRVADAADVRAGQLSPGFTDHAAAVRCLGRRVETRLRHHLPGLRRRGPFQIRLRGAGFLDILDPDVHPVSGLQADLISQLFLRLIGRSDNKALVVDPQPRAVIDGEIKRVELGRLRLDAAAPDHAEGIRSGEGGAGLGGGNGSGKQPWAGGEDEGERAGDHVWVLF